MPPTERKTIPMDRFKNRLNLHIATCKTPEGRQALQSFGTDILIALDAYNGFNYLGWMNGGCAQWMADGEPIDNTKYLGDQTMVRIN